MKLLIIEDDPHILSFLTRGFSEDGYIVESAKDGAEGEYLALMNTRDARVEALYRRNISLGLNEDQHRGYSN